MTGVPDDTGVDVEASVVAAVGVKRDAVDEIPEVE